MPTKDKYGSMTFFNYHNDSLFGLARDHTKDRNTKKSEWDYPTMAKKKEHTKKTNKLV